MAARALPRGFFRFSKRALRRWRSRLPRFLRPRSQGRVWLGILDPDGNVLAEANSLADAVVVALRAGCDFGACAPGRAQMVGSAAHCRPEPHRAMLDRRGALPP